jgi:AcrR family transcriptional regulator
MDANEHPVNPARGEATRAALIAAAIHVFGRDGFDAASTRAIADEAGANQALIGYHFGGKPGLYLAALEHITERVRERVGPLAAIIDAELGTAGKGDASGPSAERALERVQQLADALLAMLTSEESAAWARLILREQQDPSAGFDVLYGGIMRPLLAVMTRLIGRIRRVPSEEPAVRLTAVTLVGQILVFRVARAAVVRQMGWLQLGADEVAAIREQLRRNIAAILTEESTQ